MLGKDCVVSALVWYTGLGEVAPDVGIRDSSGSTRIWELLDRFYDMGVYES